METQAPPETMNNVQDNNQNQDIHQQLAEMRTLVGQLCTDNQALQVTKAPNHRPPLQDSTNTQAYFQPQPYFAPPPPYFQQYNGRFNQGRNQGYRNNNTSHHQFGNQSYNRWQPSGGYQGNRRRNQHYSWTHSMCNHQSAACQTPMEGHQKDATQANRMGGNPRGTA